MAQAGLGSRRACEDMISQGRVEVDGKIAALGTKADPRRQRIVVDGQTLTRPEEMVYVALYKPKGVLCVSQDDRGRRTVRDLVPLPGHLYPVGRLDTLSEGLVILTNDGELTNLLTHPRYGHTKEYQACVAGLPNERALEKWRQGVFLDDKRTEPAEVSIIRTEQGQTWLRLVLHEGRKRQIRRVGMKLGHQVRQLIRVRIGPVLVGDLQPGQWRPLNDQELKALKEVKRQGVKSKDVKRKDVKRKDVERKDVKSKDVKRKGVERKDVKRKDVKRKGVKRKM
jgi:pseudouridine synthase